MRCEVVKEFPRLQELAPLWRKWAANSNSDVFQSWEWAQAYWAAYGSKLRLCAPVVFRDREPIAVLPLVQKGHHIEFLSSRWSDYNDILYDGDHDPAAILEAALAAMLQEDGWRECLFDCLLSGSTILGQLSALPVRIRRHLQLVSRSPAPTIILGEDKRQVLQKLANKGHLRRYRNQFDRLGHVTFRHIETREEARSHLEPFFHQHITRWALAGKPSEFLDPDQRAFYSAMVETFDPGKELRFAVVEVNGLPVAYHFGFQTNGKLTWYKPAFNVNFWNYAPGDALLRSLFQYAEEADLREFDFSLGDEPYKYHYANLVKQTYMLYFDRRPAHLLVQVRRAERTAREAIRRRPQLKLRLEHLLESFGRIYANRRISDWIDAARNWFGRLIWKKAGVTLYRCECAQPDRSSMSEAFGEKLDRLAELSIAFPRLIGHSRLLEAKKRLKAGDRALAVRCRAEDSPVIVWLGKRSEIAMPGSEGHCKIRLGVEVPLIFDIWFERRPSRESLCAEVLRAVLKKTSGPELWIACPDDSPVPAQALADAGFRRNKRASYTALFHWLRRTHVLEAPEPAEEPLELSNEIV